MRRRGLEGGLAGRGHRRSRLPPRPAQGDRAHPEGASEAELRKRTLTNIYSARPAWMANAHAVLDRAVFAAYGWPEEFGDEGIPKNLSALDPERSARRQGRSSSGRAPASRGPRPLEE